VFCWVVNNMNKIPLIPEEEVVSISIWKPIMKAYRYDTIPTDKQYIKAIRTLESLRKYYNQCLEDRKDAWENGKWRITYKDQQDHLKKLTNGLDKENIELGKELQEIYAQLAQNQAWRLDHGYKRYFERCQNNEKNPKKYRKPGHPRFKSRNRMKSFTFPQYGYGCNIVNEKGKNDINGDRIRLSKIGDIKFIKHKEIGDPGIPFLMKTITIKKEVDKLIFIPVIETFSEIEVHIDIYKKLNKEGTKPNILINLIEEDKKKWEKIEREFEDLLMKISKANDECKETGTDEIGTIEDLKKELDELNKKCVGNDMGLPKLITDSNGNEIKAPEYLDRSLKRLRKEQKKLARKKKYDVFEVEVEVDKITGKEIVKKDPKTGEEIVKKDPKSGEAIIKRDPKTNKKIWKGSKNRDDQVEKVAKVHRHIKNQRLNSSHIISKRKVKDNDLNICEKLPIDKMIKDRRFSRRIADSGWGHLQRLMTYKAAWAGKIVDFVDPAHTSQSCSDCGRLVGDKDKWIWIDREKEIVRCPFCGLEINIHKNAARNIRNRSPIYQQKLDMIYQRLSDGTKDMIKQSEERLKNNIYCWSLDPEDSFTEDPKMRISRDATARIYAFGEVTSTCGQVTSSNQESSLMKDGKLADTKLQAPPAIGETESGVRLIAHPLGRGELTI